MEIARLIKKKDKKVTEIKEEEIVIPISQNGTFYDKDEDECLIEIKQADESCHEFNNKCFWLNPDYDWKLVQLEGDEGNLTLIALRKGE